MEDDLLNVVYKYSAGMMEIQLVRIIYYFCAILHTIVNCWTLYAILTLNDGKMFVRYGPICFGTIYSVSMIVTMLSTKQGFINFRKLVTQLARPIDCCGYSTKTRITKRAGYVKTSLIFLTVLCVLADFSFFPIWDANGGEDTFYAVVIFNRHFGKSCAKIMLAVYFVSFVPVGSISTILTMITGYVIAHCVFQTLLLNEMFAEIAADRMLNVSQRRLAIKLKSCVIFHNDIYTMTDQASQMCTKPLVASVVFGSMAAISAMTAYYTNASEDNLPRIFLSGLIIALVATFLSYIGQELKNQTEMLTTMIYHCHWYSWNKQNRKTLFLIMIFSNREFHLSQFTFVDLDYSFGLTLWKFSYSVNAIVSTLPNVQM